MLGLTLQIFSLVSEVLTPLGLPLAAKNLETCSPDPRSTFAGPPHEDESSF